MLHQVMFWTMLVLGTVAVFVGTPMVIKTRSDTGKKAMVSLAVLLGGGSLAILAWTIRQSTLEIVASTVALWVITGRIGWAAFHIPKPTANHS